MTVYHIEPIIVPPWTPEGQATHEDPQLAAYARIAEVGYRIQWVENESPTIDYFKRDKPDDFYQVAYPRSPLENTLGALVFQLAEQVNTLKDEMKELREWDGDMADLAHDTIMSATCSDDLTPAQVQSLRHVFTDLLIERNVVLEQTQGERDVAMNEVNRLNAGVDLALEQMRAININAKEAAVQTQVAAEQTRELLETAHEQAKAHTYWYRRACFAEAILGNFEPLKETLTDALTLAVDRQAGAIDEHVYREAEAGLPHVYAGLDRVLAEMRKTGKPEIENLEDYVRQERQRKMHGWALRSFGLDRMGIYDRAVRLYEESVELFFAWIYDAVAEDLQIDHGPEAHAKWVEVAQNARDHAIRVLDAKMVEPPGKVEQEIGGVALTLNIGAQVSGHAVALCERQEFERVLSKPQTHWTAREAFKQDQGL